MRVALVFANTVRYGGHVTFTAHLYRALKDNGVSVRLYTPSTRTETFPRKFGYGLKYWNITPKDLLKEDRQILITAPSKPLKEPIDALLAGDARIVVHDPAEFRHGWSLDRAKKNGIIVIRKSMLEHLPKADLILHPYKRFYQNDEDSRSKFGISFSRIDYDKHTSILLDANRILPKRKKIDIRGFENRIYTRFNIMPKYPEWKQSIAAYPREFRFAVKMAHDYRFMFDMSVIKKDGGGTQYTFLEAMDAGAVCVLNEEWIIKGHVMKPGVNCLSVANAKDIKKLAREAEDRLDIRYAGYRLLKKHDHIKIGQQYVEVLK